MKDISDATFATAFEHSVSTSAIFWIGGQGDWNPVDEVMIEDLKCLLGKNAKVHPSMAPVIEAITLAEKEGNGADDYLECMLGNGLRGFLVTLMTPIPVDFRETAPGSDRWTWSRSWGLTTGITVYVEDLGAIAPIMASFKLEVVQRELARHNAKRVAP